MTSAELSIIVDEFAKSVAALLPSAPEPVIERLARATRDLITAVCDTASVQSASTVTPLIERQERQAIRLSELERRLNGVRQHSAEAQHQADRKLDLLRAEQLEPTKRDELIAELYHQGVRVSGLEQRITALEQQAGGADANRGR